MTEMSIQTAQTAAPAAHDAHDGHGALTKERIFNSKLAMWLYLGSEVMIFGALIAAFVVFRLTEAGYEQVHFVHEELGILLVSFNTFLLLASSYAMVMSLRAIQRDNLRGFTFWMGGTALLGAIFVLLQYVEYSELARIGMTIETPFGSHFYPPTAFHGAHVIVGVLWALVLVWRGNRVPTRYGRHNHLGIEIFGLYWHFVDVVWIVLFTIIYLI